MTLNDLKLVFSSFLSLILIMSKCSPAMSKSTHTWRRIWTSFMFFLSLSKLFFYIECQKHIWLFIGTLSHLHSRRKNNESWQCPNPPGSPLDIESQIRQYFYINRISYPSVLDEQLKRILVIVLVVCSVAAAAVLTVGVILVVKIRRMTEWKVRKHNN